MVRQDVYVGDVGDTVPRYGRIEQADEGIHSSLESVDPVFGRRRASQIPNFNNNKKKEIKR